MPRLLRSFTPSSADTGLSCSPVPAPPPTSWTDRVPAGHPPPQRPHPQPTRFHPNDRCDRARTSRDAVTLAASGERIRAADRERYPGGTHDCGNPATCTEHTTWAVEPSWAP